MDASHYTGYLQRALDLAALNIGKQPQGALLGWVVMKKGVVLQEGASDLFSTSNALRWEGGTLFLSINTLASLEALDTFCSTHGFSSYFVATALDSPVREAALHLNRRYLTWKHKKRPYIILKWAETTDGFIAPADRQPYWISSAQSRQLVHQWRSQEAAIWAGKNTYHYDNPRLNVRDWEGLNPVRVVVDPALRLSSHLNVFDQSQLTLCYNEVKNEQMPNLEYISIKEGNWHDRIRAVLSDLYQRNILSVLVEGGSVLLDFLVENGWWDEARQFSAPVIFGNGVVAPKIDKSYWFDRRRISKDILTAYYSSAFLKAEEKIEKQ